MAVHMPGLTAPLPVKATEAPRVDDRAGRRRLCDQAMPQARVDGAAVGVPGSSLSIAGNDLCRVVRRREFDARLAHAARDRGVELREDARVLAVARDGAGVRVETEDGAWWAPVVI